MKERVSSMNIERIELTPRMAERFLSKNYNKQRKVNYNWVETIASDIREGRWYPNLPNSALVFSKRGEMLDGQHRCLAVMRANIPVRTYAIYDADESVFRNIDNGIARKTKDFIDCKNATVVSSIATFAVCINKGASIASAASGVIKNVGSKNGVKRSTNLKPSKDQVLSYYDKNAEYLEQIGSYASSVYTTAKIGTQAVFAKTMWLIDYVEGKDESFASIFFDDIKEIMPSTFSTARLVKKFHEMSKLKSAHNVSFRQYDQMYLILTAYDKFKECKDFSAADIKKTPGIWNNRVAIAKMNKEKSEVV